MDWLGIQSKTRVLLEPYFFSRSLTKSRVESARSRDIGEQAKDIDAAVRAIVRDNLDPQLKEDQKDILAIRLHWAWQKACVESLKPFERIEIETEEDLETVLIAHWAEYGRKEYQPISLERPRGNALHIPTNPGGHQSRLPPRQGRK